MEHEFDHFYFFKQLETVFIHFMIFIQLVAANLISKTNNGAKLEHLSDGIKIPQRNPYSCIQSAVKTNSKRTFCHLIRVLQCLEQQQQRHGPLSPSLSMWGMNWMQILFRQVLIENIWKVFSLPSIPLGVLIKQNLNSGAVCGFREKLCLQKVDEY